MATNVAALLRDLPSRGAFVSSTPSTVPRRPLPTYIAAHDTAPPPNQVIQTDPTNLLIRSLTIKRKQQEDATRAARAGAGTAAAAAAAPSAAPKRAAPAPPAAAPASKRAAGGASGSGAAGASVAAPAPPPGSPPASPSEAELKKLTKAALVDRARAAGVPYSGATKPVLVARLLAKQRGEGA